MPRDTFPLNHVRFRYVVSLTFLIIIQSNGWGGRGGNTVDYNCIKIKLAKPVKSKHLTIAFLVQFSYVRFSVRSHQFLSARKQIVLDFKPLEQIPSEANSFTSSGNGYVYLTLSYTFLRESQWIYLPQRYQHFLYPLAILKTNIFIRLSTSLGHETIVCYCFIILSTIYIINRAQRRVPNRGSNWLHIQFLIKLAVCLGYRKLWISLNEARKIFASNGWIRLRLIIGVYVITIIGIVLSVVQVINILPRNRQFWYRKKNEIFLLIIFFYIILKPFLHINYDVLLILYFSDLSGDFMLLANIISHTKKLYTGLSFNISFYWMF